MSYSKHNFIPGDVLQAKPLNEMDNQIYENSEKISQVGNTITELKKDLSSLITRLQSGSIENAELHLGFYLDENGDLCQKEE